MSSLYTLDSTGRTAERSEKMPNGMYRYNRSDISFSDMQFMNRRDGDLFAVFQDDAGNVRIQYANVEDYAFAAIEQMQEADLKGAAPDQRDYQMIVGSIILSRVHDYSLHGFVNLLDHNLDQVFDLHDLLTWIAKRPEFFMSPAEEAVAEDAYDREMLEAEFASQGEIQ